MLAGPVLFGRACGFGWTTLVFGAVFGVARRSELGTDLGPSFVVFEGAAAVTLGWPCAPFVDIFEIRLGPCAGSLSHHVHVCQSQIHSVR